MIVTNESYLINGHNFSNTTYRIRIMPLILLMIGVIVSAPLQAQSPSNNIISTLSLLLCDEDESVEIVEIAIGNSHSCARMVDGTVK